MKNGPHHLLRHGPWGWGCLSHAGGEALLDRLVLGHLVVLAPAHLVEVVLRHLLHHHRLVAGPCRDQGGQCEHQTKPGQDDF